MPRAAAALAIFALCLGGCSFGQGNRLSLFPEGNKLLDATKAVKAAFGEPQALPHELDKHVAAPYVVEPGDVLLVQPADLDSSVRFPGDQPVLPDGTINLGRYGQLQVAGRTVAEIEMAVKAQIEAVVKAQPPPKEPRDPLDRRDPRDVGPITVRVVTRQSKVYYVLGEVNAPGVFTLKGNETVLDAILNAGGLNDRASRKHIVLSRPTPPQGCRVVLPICYREIVQLGDTSTNYQIAAGDRVFVPTREFSEQIHHRKPDCPPCGGPQAPCAALGPPRACSDFKPAEPAASPVFLDAPRREK